MPPTPDRPGDHDHRRRSIGAQRTAPYIRHEGFDWHARRLDPWSFERVLEALSICRTGNASAA
jgi:hypothetical protein